MSDDHTTAVVQRHLDRGRKGEGAKSGESGSDKNIALALVTKALVLLLAVFGLANLWMAIAADVGTSLLVVADAMRLLRRRPEWGG